MWFIAVFIIIGLGAFAWWFRGFFQDWSKNDDESSGSGFSLADLRNHHRAGLMTDEEFERAKVQLLQTVTPPKK